MLTVIVLLALFAFIIAIASGMGRAPLWVAVLLLAIIHLLASVPLGR